MAPAGKRLSCAEMHHKYVIQFIHFHNFPPELTRCSLRCEYYTASSTALASLVTLSATASSTPSFAEAEVENDKNYKQETQAKKMNAALPGSSL